MASESRTRFTWRLRTRSVPLGRRTALMGILNVTPDSFSDGNRYFDARAAIGQGLKLLDEGADLLDIGGESTRPNATPVEPAEEQARVLPVLLAILKARPDALISVDTYHAATAQRAMEGGAEIVNDVSGLLWDSDMGVTMARGGVGAVLMHTRGAPRMWATLPALRAEDVMPLVLSGLTHSLQLARVAGIASASLVIDPGFGFGKIGEENMVLLAGLAALKEFNLPMLVGVSRKRFLTEKLPQATDEMREHATTAANVAAVLAGAHILRVHDVAAARAGAAVADALLPAR